MDDIRASISVAAACLGTDGDLRPLSPALCRLAVAAAQASRHPEAHLRSRATTGQNCWATSASGTRWGTPWSTPAWRLLLQLVLGMLIALLLDSDRKGYGLLRAMMTLPLVIPPAVTAMMFLLMLNGSFGVLSARHHRHRAAAAGLLHSGHCVHRDGGRAAGRGLAMDAVHGADHAGGASLAAQGTLRGRRHRRGDGHARCSSN